MASSEILTQKQKFRAAFESLLRVDAGFLPVVHRWLNKYGLFNITSVEILSEVYLDGFEAIEKGTIIKNPKAWVRKVAFNKVANKMRNQYKDKQHFNFIELDAIECIDDIEYEMGYKVKS